jgi:hypothetical protein
MERTILNVLARLTKRARILTGNLQETPFRDPELGGLVQRRRSLGRALPRPLGSAERCTTSFPGSRADMISQDAPKAAHEDVSPLGKGGRHDKGAPFVASSHAERRTAPARHGAGSEWSGGAVWRTVKKRNDASPASPVGRAAMCEDDGGRLGGDVVIAVCFGELPILSDDQAQPFTNASRSGLITSALVVSMPCGYPL